MKMFVCTFQSLADFQQCFPNSKPYTEEQFQSFVKAIDSQVVQFEKQGSEVVQVSVVPSEYLDWYFTLSDDEKNLSDTAKMTNFASFKGNQDI